jgi:flagellar basal body P-ring protein FlgI
VAGVIFFIAAIVASPKIETQLTEIGDIAAIAGVSSLALVGFGGLVSGILLIWALKKSGQIESMEKSLRKIAYSISAIENLQKERLNELRNNEKVQKTVDKNKDSEKPNS